MKAICLSIFLFFVSESPLFAEMLEFRLAHEKEGPNTEVIFDNNVGRLFVENDPFLTMSDISKANLIIDNNNPPDWLTRAVKSTGSIVIKPQIKIEILLKESGREIIKQITSENIGKKTAVFINGKCIMAPSIEGKIDSDKFFITTS